MKKQLIAASLAVFISGSAQADFLRVDAGAGMWQSTPTGTVSYNLGGVSDTLNASDDLGYKEESISYFWLNFKHPVPILPNFRVEYTAPSFDGTATQGIKWEGIDYSANSYSKLQVKQTDLVLYYNLLDNTFWATLDLGLDVKLADFSYELSDPSNASIGYNDSASVVLPLLYARTRIEIPATNIGLEADVKFISYGNTQIYDARAKVDYTFDFVPVIQPAIELGYRTQKFTIDEENTEFKTAIDFSGIYAGLMLRF